MPDSVCSRERLSLMQRIRIQITGPGAGPGRVGRPGILARILVTIVAVCALVVAAFLGAFFFLAALGLFFIASVVMAIRIWWARRRLQGAPGGEPSSQSGGRGGRRRGPAGAIEGEYRVLDEGGDRRESERGGGGEH